MQATVNFESLGYYIKACKGKLLDALLLLYIEDRIGEERSNEWVVIESVDIRTDLHCSNAQIRASFERIANRFGIERKIDYWEPSNCNVYWYKYDYNLTEALLEVYWNE